MVTWRDYEQAHGTRPAGAEVLGRRPRPPSRLATWSLWSRVVPLVALAVAGAAVLVAVAAYRHAEATARTERLRSCPVWYAQAAAPAAPGASQDHGALSAAAAARTTYEDAHCAAGGYLPTPPVITGR